MSEVRALLLSLANEAQKKQARGEKAELTPEVIAGFLIREQGANAERFAERVVALIVDANVPAPKESAAVRKRRGLRLVK